MINFNVYYDNNSQKKINKTENFLISSDLKSKIKIINDIPRFCESEYTKNFGDQWSNYPEDQFDESNDETYKNLNIARDTLQEVFPIKLDKIENANILEAGSGNGRFTYIMLKNGAKVDTFDKGEFVELPDKDSRIWFGGGTDYTPVFEYIENDLDDSISYLVYLTDGYCIHSHIKEPDYPVIWATTGTKKYFKFGDVVDIE